METDIETYYTGFSERVRDIIAYGYTHSSALRKRMESAQLQPTDIQTTAALSHLPVLRKEELSTQQREGVDLGGMLTVPLGNVRRIFQSPGPIYEPEAPVSDPWRWAPALQAAGFGPGDIVFNAFGYHLTPAGAMFEEGARALGCAIVPGGIGAQVQQIEAIRVLGVTAYVGLPSYLKNLLEKARDIGYNPRDWALHKAFVSAEPLPPSLRALFEAEYGIAVYQGYGTAECGNLGYEGKTRNGWHLPTDALVQICDINSGRPLPIGHTGEVVVTLFRRDYIVVRLAVGDLSAILDAPLAEDIATPRLVGWLGRSGDSIKVRGIFVHPRHAAEALQRVAGITAYRIVVYRQAHRDELTCRIVPDLTVDCAILRATVAAALYEKLKLHCNVECVERVPEQASAFVDERTWE